MVPELPLDRLAFRHHGGQGSAARTWWPAISKAFDVAAKSEALEKFADEKAVFLVNLKERGGR